MPTTKQRASTEEVYAALRSDVLGCVFRPGEKLKFTPLCERYGASVSVIREALTRLAEQGLVEAEPRIGFRVRSLSMDDLQDLNATRIDLEVLALRYSIERGDVEWESALVAAHHRLERTPMHEEGATALTDEWEAAHVAFHSALLTGCASSWLLGITQTLRDAAEFYRRWSYTQQPDRDIAGEHHQILTAALDRDAERATDLLAQHYRRTAQIVEAALQAERPGSS